MFGATVIDELQIHFGLPHLLLKRHHGIGQ